MKIFVFGLVPLETTKIFVYCLCPLDQEIGNDIHEIRYFLKHHMSSLVTWVEGSN